MIKDKSKISNTYIPPICMSLKSICFWNSRYLKNKVTTATKLTDTFFFIRTKPIYIGMYILPFTTFHFLLLVLERLKIDFPISHLVPSDYPLPIHSMHL